MNDISQTFKSLSAELGNDDTTLKSFYTQDPLTGNTVIHGATNNRPKAYAGEHIECPWDNPKNILLNQGSAFITQNDFPALSPESVNDEPKEIELSNTYSVKNARGECLMVIYSHKHQGHWLSLTDQEKEDVVKLWAQSTQKAKEMNFVFAHVFETDGPKNTMTHPHGQQYNFCDVPPDIELQIQRAQQFFNEKGQNIFDAMYQAEIAGRKRIVYENGSFIVYAPPGAKWPFQTRILPRRRVLWLYEFNEQEQKDLVDALTQIRRKYNNYFSLEYKPTYMINILQTPFDKTEEHYRSIFGLRVEIYCTALSQKAEKFMFSLENSTGLIAYSYSPEEVAEKLR